MRKKARRNGDRLIKFVVVEVFVFIKQPFRSPDWLIARLQVGIRERSCREKFALPDSDLGL